MIFHLHLFATLTKVLPDLPINKSGQASVLFAFEKTYPFDRQKVEPEGGDRVLSLENRSNAKWSSLTLLPSSGMCGLSLTHR